ncbi:MAG: zinc ribbon domain-containing protein [Firmicutes bacterium]|nr:zinc ribbon domain-containing protein [Bacillota bacterium]
MKDFFGKVTGAVSKTVGQVVEGAENATETAKLKMAINKAKGRMDEKKTELGGVVYQCYKDQQSDDAKMNALCEEIKAIEAEITRLEIAVKEVGHQAAQQPVQQPAAGAAGIVCVNCASPLTEKDVFCANCGTKQPPKAEPQPAGPLTCPNCSSVVTEKDVFCNSCGNKLK